MTSVFELVDDAAGNVLDTVTFNGDEASYATGVARSLVVARLRILGDQAAMVASLDGWSNGYVTTRRAGGS